MSRSFLKWAGGKYRVAVLLEEIIQNSPPFDIRWTVDSRERYHEPFLGSASMYLHLHKKGLIKTRKPSYLSDLNHILICTMNVVSNANNIPLLLEKLSELQRLYPMDKPHPNPRGQSKEKREKRLFYRMRIKMNKLAKKYLI